MNSVTLLFQASERRSVKVQADDPIAFSQLINKSELGATEVRYLYTIGNALLSTSIFLWYSYFSTFRGMMISVLIRFTNCTVLKYVH